MTNTVRSTNTPTHLERYAQGVPPTLRQAIGPSGAGQGTQVVKTLNHQRTDTLIARDELYGEFAPLIRRLIHQYGVTAEFRQDLMGEIYYRFCKLLDVFDPDRGVPLRPYLVRQLTAAIYTYARKQWSIERRETALLADDFGQDQRYGAFDPTPLWDADLSRKEVIASLPAAIRKLPDRQKKVVVWRYYENRSFEEIAQLLSVECSTARSLLRHGLTNLRKQMQSDDVLDL